MQNCKSNFLIIERVFNEIKGSFYRRGCTCGSKWAFTVELGVIKKDPTEYAYLKKDKKTIEELEEDEIPKYLEKEELALFLKTASIKG